MLTTSNKEKLIAGAQKLVEKGQFDKAIREYLKVVAEDEDDVRVWIRIGDLYVKLGQKSEAVENYKKVAQLYTQQGEPEKAIAVYKQILQTEPQTLETYMLLAALYRDMGRLQHASQQYELAAQLYTRAGRLREALAAEQALVDMVPDNIARRIKLAELYSRENLYPDAAREFSAAAAVLRSTGRMDDFAKVSERLLFHAPDNLEVTKDLARYYLQQGDAVRALTKLQGGFKVDRKDVELLDLLAQAFERMSKPDKAVSVLRELARIYTERGALSAADSTNRHILELDPKDEAARAALSHSAPSPRRLGAQGGQGGQAAGKSGSNPNLNASLFNSPVPQTTPSSQPGTPPPSAPPPAGPVAVAPLAGTTPALGSAAPSAQQISYAAEEEAGRVIAEAESFARFGLNKRAIEHLLATLQSKPGLRPVRERLAKLYEAQGQPRGALAELRLLLAQAASPAEELRQLREIVRLDSKDEEAATRLRTLSASAAASAAAGEGEDDDDEPEISVSSASGEDGGQRRGAPSDADTTSRMPLAQFNKFVQNQSLLRTIPPVSSGAAADSQSAAQSGGGPGSLPSQSTAPNAEAVAAAAEEMALTSGTLKEELDEVDFFLQQKMYDEAQQLLKSLLTRYPHSKTVLAKQSEVANQAVVDDVVIDVDIDDVRELDAESTARLSLRAVTAAEEAARLVAPRRAMAPPATPSGGRLPPLPPARPPATPGRGVSATTTQPLHMPSGRSLPSPSGSSLPGPVSASGRSLPSPSLNEKTAASADASGAFRLGVSYRNRGQYGQAVSEFQKALADQKRAARAALMLGLCYRDQNQLKEAIEAFKEGVHMPGISDPDLGELHYQLGRSYEQLGDVGEAIHFYQQALKPNGRFKDADSRIAALQGKSSRSLK